MDTIHRQLINLLQEKFPIASRPFLILGEQLGICEDEVIARIKALKESGYIRRLGGIFDSGHLGYSSTLCALSVPSTRVDEVAAVINGYDCVTHNYLRDDHFNMWFTLIAPSKEKVEEILNEIREKTAVNQILSLPSQKVYKIRTNFSIKR